MCVYTCTHILVKWDHGAVVQKKVCLGPRAATTVFRSAIRASLPWRHGLRIQVTGKSITAVYLSEWKLKISRWGGVTPTWQSGKIPAERMKSLPKMIMQSPIYFSRAVTFYTEGGCGPVFFLCVIFLFMMFRKAEIAITLHLTQDMKTCTPAVTHWTPSFLVHWEFNCGLSFHAHARTNMSL